MDRTRTGTRTVAFDFWVPDGSLAGFAVLTIGPRRAEYWAGLVGANRPFVLVQESDIAPPRRPESWEIRAEGLWADHNCETPGEHWSFGLEAFGLSFDNADDAVAPDQWGDRMALGYDLEWEPEVCHGEILVGTERIAFDGLGDFSQEPTETPQQRWARWVQWARLAQR